MRRHCEQCGKVVWWAVTGSLYSLVGGETVIIKCENGHVEHVKDAGNHIKK